MRLSLKYTLVAEGFAEYRFISIYMSRVADQYDIQTSRTSLDLLKKQPSKSKVLDEAENLCLRAIRDEKHSLCIVGVDLDKPDNTDEQSVHQGQCQELYKAIGTAYKRYNRQIILYVPIQAIEHWLMYQFYVYKSGTAKPNIGSIEKEPQGKLKKLLYGDKEDRRRMESVAQAIAEKADFNELAKQSRSFKHFHQQIITFLEQYNKPQP